MTVGPESIDPAWWSPAFGNAQAGQTEEPELLSSKLFTLANDAAEDSLQRRALAVLARASSAMLEPEDWGSPFSPAMQLSERRTIIPGDLNSDEVSLLGQIAPLINQPTLRSRVADVAWFYGDRSNRDLLITAIDSYLSLPLDRLTWVRITHDSWRRGLEMARRSGPAASAQLHDGVERLREHVLDGTSDDFLVADCSELLRVFGRLKAEVARPLANHVRVRAETALVTNVPMSRRLEEEARAWYFKSQEVELARDCSARIAQTYVLEAEQRLAEDTSAAIITGRLYERAIAELRQLPTRYRQQHGLEGRIRDLEERSADSRQALLGSMVAIESEPVDLTETVKTAQQLVSGKSPGKALHEFCRLRPAFDLDEFMKSAREQSLDGFSRIFTQETYNSDGQRVAARGGSTEETDADYFWAQAVKNFDIRVGVIVTGLILPAQEVMTFEHRYSYPRLLHLCLESPRVPSGHEALWARGIWHGFRQDYPSAASLLVPQIEHLIRSHLKRNGIRTLTVDARTGVESEKGLGALLDLPQSPDIFGDDTIFELKALLVSQEGANLRNDIAHGLFNDRASVTFHTVYIWWLALSIAFTPLFTKDEASASPAENS